jgi:hypothetical protein
MPKETPTMFAAEVWVELASCFVFSPLVSSMATLGAELAAKDCAHRADSCVAFGLQHGLEDGAAMGTMAFAAAMFMLLQA